MTLESGELPERTRKCNRPHTCLCFSIKMIPLIYSVQTAPLYGSVKEFPTFRSDFQKALCGGFVSETTPSVILFLGVQGAVQAFATSWLQRWATLKQTPPQVLPAMCNRRTHICMHPSLPSQSVHQSVIRSISKERRKKETK